MVSVSGKVKLDCVPCEQDIVHKITSMQADGPYVVAGYGHAAWDALEAVRLLEVRCRCLGCLLDTGDGCNHTRRTALMRRCLLMADLDE